MNHLVFLDAQAGELEKILSGMKRMIMKEFDPAQIAAYSVRPSDNLYFLRNNDELTLRVNATVVRIFSYEKYMSEDLRQKMKEMQAKLQLTEDQYNYWSAKNAVLFIEFDRAHKIDAIKVSLRKISSQSDWIAFEDFNEIL